MSTATNAIATVEDQGGAYVVNPHEEKSPDSGFSVNSARVAEGAIATTEHPPVSADELLTPAELSTVLTMLTLIDTIVDLDLLECLTPEQKRQVWNQTPIEVRMRLWQLRQQASTTDSISSSQARVQSEAGVDENVDEDVDEEHHSELGMPDHLSGRSQPSKSQDLPQPIQVGDRVVVKAKPEVSKAELLAVFEVVDIQDQTIFCQDRSGKAKEMGVKCYPLDWVMPYSRSKE